MCKKASDKSIEVSHAFFGNAWRIFRASHILNGGHGMCWFKCDRLITSLCPPEAFGTGNTEEHFAGLRMEIESAPFCTSSEMRGSETRGFRTVEGGGKVSLGGRDFHFHVIPLRRRRFKSGLSQR